MNRVGMTAAFLLLGMSLCLGQSSSPAPGDAAAQPAATPDATAIHGVIPTSLAKSIDSKKLKEGDEITTKTVSPLHTNSGILIPSGSKVIGHVTQSKSRSKGDSEASLGVMFDKIEVAGGKDMPIKGVIQAVGPNPSEHSGPDTGAAGGGTMAAHGGDPTTMASPVSGAGPDAGQKLGAKGGTMLSSRSTGVVGIKNLQLDNSVLTSTGKDVKLDQGAQLMIKAE